jgi:hypothetical protein
MPIDETRLLVFCNRRSVAGKSSPKRVAFPGPTTVGAYGLLRPGIASRICSGSGRVDTAPRAGTARLLPGRRPYTLRIWASVLPGGGLHTRTT